MRIAVCDDNAADVINLLHIIKKKEIFKAENITVYTSSNQLFDDISSKKYYDIILLDIDMPNINGIALGKHIRNHSPDTFIVFITNYPQYAIEAFDCEANGYLIKPLDEIKTNETLERIIKKSNLLKSHRNSYHIIKMHNRKERILIKDIYWVKCEKKHVIYMLKNTSYDTVGTLSDAYKALKDHGFYQVHQGYIVNMDKIKKFESYYALLDNGAKVEISVRKRREFLIAYAKYIEENA